MKDLDKRQSEAINAMRFPLIVLVVFGHMLGFGNQAIAPDFSGDACYAFITELMSHGLARITVPAFFLFSGYFFFRKMTEWHPQFYFSQIKGRVRTLLVPYLIWNFLMISAIFIKNDLFVRAGLGEDELIRSVKGNSWYFLLWGMPINFPLWYLRELICMSLITPLFYALFRYGRIYGLLLILTVYLAGWETGLKGFSTWALWFFGLGAYLGINKINILYYTLPWKTFSYWAAAVLLLLTTGLIGTAYHRYSSNLFLIFGVIAAINLMDHLNESGRTAFFLRMSGSVFFIYAIHEIYIINWLKGALYGSVLNDIWYLRLLGYFIVPFVCVAVCLVLYSCCRKIAPKLLAYSIGGR